MQIELVTQPEALARWREVLADPALADLPAIQRAMKTNLTKKSFRSKRRSCALCKPQKMHWEIRGPCKRLKRQSVTSNNSASFRPPFPINRQRQAGSAWRSSTSQTDELKFCGQSHH
jgi:hypothetical protein